ncbi:alpha/beta hydrolase family protein [Amycolatopsis sp. lyj-23]|uniref:alpha/beta hydrolase family protein n=1 Tax=Amycolatopsis sp. lyj-23 TaxID=2789283 RepID=UPI00397CC1DA
MSLANVLALRARPADRTEQYGSGPERVAEIWQGGEKVAVVVHGGFWAAEYDRAHIRPFCAALADHGYTTVAVEYHRVGQRAGGWPGTFTDVAAAVDALPRLTGGLARRETTVLVGHSAGGHLALWTALRDRLPDGGPGIPGSRLEVGGVVSLAGVCDLVDGHRRNLDDGAVHRLLGGPPDDLSARYRVADPIRLVPSAARCVLVHGDQDDRVPVSQSVRFHAAALAQGGDVRLTILPGTGHFELIDPTSAAFDAVLDAIRTAFAAPDYLAPTGSDSVK